MKEPFTIQEKVVVVLFVVCLIFAAFTFRATENKPSVITVVGCEGDNTGRWYVQYIINGNSNPVWCEDEGQVERLLWILDKIGDVQIMQGVRLPAGINL